MKCSELRKQLNIKDLKFDFEKLDEGGKKWI